MQNSRWFAKFPHPICATVLQKERPTPPPTLKKPAKTAPLPSKTQFQPNKSRPLPDKARHLPSKTQTCPNCHTKHITIAHTHAPPLCHTSAGRAQPTTLLPNCVATHGESFGTTHGKIRNTGVEFNNKPRNATKTTPNKRKLPTTLLCKHTTRRH